MHRLALHKRNASAPRPAQHHAKENSPQAPSPLQTRSLQQSSSPSSRRACRRRTFSWAGWVAARRRLVPGRAARGLAAAFGRGSRKWAYAVADKAGMEVVDAGRAREERCRAWERTAKQSESAQRAVGELKTGRTHSTSVVVRNSRAVPRLIRRGVGAAAVVARARARRRVPRRRWRDGADGCWS